MFSFIVVFVFSNNPKCYFFYGAITNGLFVIDLYNIFPGVVFSMGEAFHTCLLSQHCKLGRLYTTNWNIMDTCRVFPYGHHYLQILSWNIRVFNNPVKRLAVFRTVKQLNAAVVCLQETHLPQPYTLFFLFFV